MSGRLGNVCSSQKLGPHNNQSGGFSYLSALLSVIFLITIGLGLPLGWKLFFSPSPAHAQELTDESSSLLGSIERIFTVNIPSAFKEAVTMAAITIEGEAIFGGPVSFSNGTIFDGQITLNGTINGSNGASINLGNGTLTASNVIYSLTEGDGIDISTGQRPTITNSDRGSSQDIFKKVKLGDDTAEADGNSDTLEFSAGDGISLSLDEDNDKLTITNSTSPGLVKSGTYAVFASGISRLGLGTSSPSNTLEIDSGTDGTTGITFTRLTSSSAAGVGGGKVLSVDSGGKMILVEDQTGGGGTATPSAEAVLPSATTGMTLYYNGTNWVASNNLYHDGGSVGISNTSPTSRFHVNTNLASKIGLIVQGYSSQTANLQEWRDSNNNVLSYIDSNGVFNGSANVEGTLDPGLTTGSVLFQSASGIAADSTNFFWDDSNNRLGIGTNSPQYGLDVVGGFIKSSVTNAAATGFLIDNSASPVWGVQAASGGRFEIYDYAATGSYASRLVVGTTGNVGVGSQTPTSKFHVDGASGNALVMLAQSGSGDLLTASASGTTRMVLTNAGNLGIGTNTATYKLDVGNGTATTVARINGDTFAASLYFTNETTRVERAAGNNALDLYGYSAIRLYSTQSSNQLAQFSQNGNVGFGTSSPNAKLHVTSATGVDSSMIFSQTGAQNWTIGNPASTLRFDISEADNLGTPRLSIASGGNIGVGTTSPVALLHVNGGYRGNASMILNQTLAGDIFTASASGTTRMALTNAGRLLLNTTNSNSNYQVAIGNSSTGIALLNNSGNRIRSLNAGDTGLVDFTIDAGDTIFATGSEFARFENSVGGLGIGTSTPTSKLHVTGLYGGNALAILNQTGSGDIFTASASGTTRMVLTQAGNVGIGTNTPGGTLHVNGSLVVGSSTPATIASGDIYTRGAISLGNSSAAPLSASAGVLDIVDQRNYGSGGVAFRTLANFNPTTTGLTFSGVQTTARDVTSTTSNIGTIQGTISGAAVQSSTGITVTNLQSYTTVLSIAANNTATGAYGYRVADLINNGTATNTYGVHVGDITTGTQTNTPFSFYASDANSYNYFAGRVGLGLTNPQTEMTVYAASNPRITFGNSTRSASSGFNYIGLSTDGRQLVYNGGFNTGQAGYGHVFVSDSTSTELMRIESNGTVGIGTTAPSSKFHVEGLYAGNALARFNQTSTVGDILTASASGTTRMTLTRAGYLGIGTNIPTASLHVETSDNTAATFTRSTSARLNIGNQTNYVNLTSATFNNGGYRSLMFETSSNGTMYLDTAGNVGIGTTTFGTSAGRTLAIAGSTAPSTAITDGAQLFAVDQGGSHELRVMDEAGNTTTLSPHNFALIGERSEDMAWSFYSERNALAINADMTKALRLVEKLSGEKLVYLKNLATAEVIEDETDATHITELADNGTIGEIARWSYEFWTFVGQVTFEKPVTFLAELRANGPVWLDGKVTFADKDMAGYAVIPANGQEVRVTFSTAFANKPIVSVTPENTTATFTLVDVSTEGFTVKLSAPATSETTFNWIALRVENATTTTGSVNPSPAPSPTPVVTPSPSPSASPSPSPSSTPTPSPETSPNISTGSGNLGN